MDTTLQKTDEITTYARKSEPCMPAEECAALHIPLIKEHFGDKSDESESHQRAAALIMAFACLHSSNIKTLATNMRPYLSEVTPGKGGLQRLIGSVVKRLRDNGILRGKQFRTSWECDTGTFSFILDALVASGRLTKTWPANEDGSITEVYEEVKG